MSDRIGTKRFDEVLKDSSVRIKVLQTFDKTEPIAPYNYDFIFLDTETQRLLCGTTVNSLSELSDDRIKSYIERILKYESKLQNNKQAQLETAFLELNMEVKNNGNL